jgi:hypothetical protein
MANEPTLLGEQAPLPPTEQVEHLRQERDRLHKLVQELPKEHDHLRQSLAAVQKERDQYLQALHGYLRKEYPLEKALEDFRDLRAEEGIPMADVLAECEQLVAAYERSGGTCVRRDPWPSATGWPPWASQNGPP